jgi:hypothetical protein
MGAEHMGICKMPRQVGEFPHLQGLLKTEPKGRGLGMGDFGFVLRLRLGQRVCPERNGNEDEIGAGLSLIEVWNEVQNETEVKKHT